MDWHPIPTLFITLEPFSNFYTHTHPPLNTHSLTHTPNTHTQTHTHTLTHTPHHIHTLPHLHLTAILKSFSCIFSSSYLFLSLFFPGLSPSISSHIYFISYKDTLKQKKMYRNRTPPPFPHPKIRGVSENQARRGC